MSNARFSIAIILSVLCFTIACAPLWNRVRESERETAVETARTYSKRGSCVKALQSLDRATARIDIGPFGQEATSLRMRCYERQGRHAAARAHRRMLDDFYSNGRQTLPKPDGSSVFRVSKIPQVEFTSPPEAIEIPPPHYSEAARRSYITGRVVVAFELSAEERPKAIRILEMPHPLLASWSIEAIERLKRSRRGKDALIVPGGHYITTFAFEYRWADEGLRVEDDPDGYGFPSYQ